MELHVFSEKRMVVLLDDEMRIIKPVYGFLKFQRQKDRALNTLKANGNDLKVYWRFLEKCGYNYSKVSPSIIVEFIDYLRSNDGNLIGLYCESERTGKTINRILSTVHQFYKYCSMIGEINNPILREAVSKPHSMFKSFLQHAKKDNKVRQSIFKVRESSNRIKLLTDDEIRTIYNALERTRDKLLFRTMYLTGARIQEVLDLKIEAIPIPDSLNPIGLLKEIKSKGKYRDLYMPMTLIQQLDEFILNERSRIETEHSFIFISEQPQNLGNHLTYRGIYEVFKRVKKQTGIVFNFHDLRHTFVSNLVESGMDISIVRILAGHEQISTTQKYTHLTNNFIIKSLDRFWKTSCVIGRE